VGSFIGRGSQLRELDRQLELVRAGGTDHPGKALLVRGRRRVGKSRLVGEFVRRSGVPHVYFTASMQKPEQEFALFAQEVAESDLPGAAVFSGVKLGSWEAALRLLATAVPADGPSVVVIDELPYLVAADPTLEGTLQKIFDRAIATLPVLLVLVGSDLAMMEALNEHGRPFYQRAREMVVPPLTPLEVGDMLDPSPADAFDAFLVTGGLPLICAEWPRGLSLWQFLEESLTFTTSALLVSAERALAAEFPTDSQARYVLSTVGAGERTFTSINRKAGLQPTSLTRSLTVLSDKSVIAADTPLSTKPSKETRYRIADPYLRFWLSFLGPHMPEIERGRGDRVLGRVRTSWPSWRGRAIEPVLRESLERLGPEAWRIDSDAAPAPAPAPAPEGGGNVVRGYWTRSNEPEIDIVVADRAPVARRIDAVGSIKWLESAPFGGSDLAALIRHRAQLPGASDTTPLIAVSRSGSTVSDVTALGPEQLLDGWR